MSRAFALYSFIISPHCIAALILLPFDAMSDSNGRTGRPRIDRAVRDVCADYTGEAIARLVAALRGDDDDKAIRAATQLLDRAWGKPAQLIKNEHTVVTPNPHDGKTNAQLLAEAESYLEILKELPQSSQLKQLKQLETTPEAIEDAIFSDE